MGFHRVVIDHRKSERVFDDLVRLREAGVGVAAPDLFMRADVAALLFVNERRVFFHRRVDTDYRRQFFVIDLNQAERLFRRR